MRHPLPAKFFRRRQCAPSSFAVLLIGIFEAFRRGHAAIVMPGAALQIADLVERKQHALDKFRAFAKDCLNHVSIRVFKTRQIGEAFDTQHFVDNKLSVADGGLITRHFVSF